MSWPRIRRSKLDRYPKSVGIAVKECAHQSQNKNFHVELHTPVLNVVKIVSYAFGNRRVAAPSVHLGPAGDPAFDVMSRHVFRNFSSETLQKEGALRSRSDDAHIALEYVYELRKFIQIAAP